VAVEQRRIETQAELKTANWEPVFSIFGLPGMDLRVGLDPLAGVVNRGSRSCRRRQRPVGRYSAGRDP